MNYRKPGSDLNSESIDSFAPARFGLSACPSMSLASPRLRSRAGDLALERCRAATDQRLLTEASLDALALVLLAVTVNKSTDGSADSKNGMSNAEMSPDSPTLFRLTAIGQNRAS
jgi:hypothetical protein